MINQGDKIPAQPNEEMSRVSEISQAFFELASLICIVLDEDSIVQDINPYGLKCLGYNKEEVVGKNWFRDFIPKNSVEMYHNLLKESVATGGADNFYCNLACHDGSERIIEWKSGVIKNHTDGSHWFILSGRDITNEKSHAESLRENINEIREWNKELETIILDRTRKLQEINNSLQSQIEESKHIQEQYLNSQRLYNAMAHNFPNGIIGVLSKEMRYVLVDGKELELLGLKSSDLIGEKIFHWETEDKGYDLFLQKAFSGEIVSFEVPFRHQTYSVTAVPLPNTKNLIEEILVVIHNITDRKELEENLYRIIAQEKKLNELKSRFVTMALHEFRTPLSTILSSVFLLESYKNDLYEEKKDIHIGRIKRTVNILTEILNDFLRLGKLEEGKVEMKLTPVNISDHAEDVLKAVFALKKSEQKLLYKHSGLNLNVLLDENLLRSILLNLLSNAIKYSFEDGEIVLETNLSSDQLLISVVDKGMGIPLTDNEHIFQRFFRGKNAEHIEGTGLGLHIVKGYLELMKGTIDFASNEEGTTFIVKIPLQLTQDETRLILLR